MEERQRIDKWLWMTRIVKTRTLATKMVSSGTVQINGIRVTKPGKSVHKTDVLTLAQRDFVHIFKINDFPTRRGPYEEAKAYYQDLSPPKTLKPAKNLPTAKREKGSGRPTKKQRRDLTAWMNRL